jgi:hypothetical protein
MKVAGILAAHSRINISLHQEAIVSRKEQRESRRSFIFKKGYVIIAHWIAVLARIPASKWGKESQAAAQAAWAGQSTPGLLASGFAVEEP